MAIPHTLLIALAFVVVAYQLFVTLLLVRSGLLTGEQLVAQSLLVWFLPLIGAIVCHWLYRLHGSYGPSPRSRETLPDPLDNGPVNDLVD
jgi:hypothetical protein